MILANDECPLCERGFIIALFCEKCRKIFDERSEKENNDIFGMVNK